MLTMATVSLNPSCNALRGNASTETGTPPLKTGLADEELERKRVLEASIWRCDSVCIQRRRTPDRDSPPQPMSWVSRGTVFHTVDAALS